MAYSQEEIEINFNLVLDQIEQGKPLRRILPEMGISNKTFYKWIELDEEKRKLYARACEFRADNLFDEIIEIADDSSQDEIVIDLGDGVTSSRQNTEFVQRSRLRIDARKWVISKLNPKKYGDRLELENKHSGSVNIISLGSGQKPNESDN